MGTNGSTRVQRTIEDQRPTRPRFRAILVVACLVALHCGPRPEERRLAIYDLKSNPTQENVKLIRDLLADADRDVRATALNALVGLDAPDSARLALHALRDPDGFVRATAAKLLGDLDGSGHVVALAECLLRDPDPVARQRAAESLTRVGGSGALEALAQGLADPMERVRMAVVEGLTKIDPGHARLELVRVLREDAVWEVRAQAAHALGLSGDPEILPDLRAALEDPNEFVRAAAGNALRLHGNVRVDPDGAEVE